MSNMSGLYTTFTPECCDVQLVCYPIVNLRRLKIGARAYVEGLEDTVIATLDQYGLQARVTVCPYFCASSCLPEKDCRGVIQDAATYVQGRIPGRTGVWVGERKIAAIGVQISHGVTRHGAALNVSTDLSYFDNIVPCGVSDKEVTSLERELSGAAPKQQEVADAFVDQFMQQFGFTSYDLVQRNEVEE